MREFGGLLAVVSESVARHGLGVMVMPRGGLWMCKSKPNPQGRRGQIIILFPAVFT